VPPVYNVLMGVFIQVENGVDCVAANDKAQGGLGFFLLGLREGDSLGTDSHYVHIKFSICSQ